MTRVLLQSNDSSPPAPAKIPSAVSIPATASPLGTLVKSMQGEGRSLSPSLRDHFEPRFGADLRGVRLHTGVHADTAARRLAARAFTVGRDIGFRSGEYRPESPEGQRLIAHELTHVLQQKDATGTIRTRVGPAKPYPEGLAYLKHLREKKTFKGTAAARRVAAKIVLDYWSKGYPHFILSPSFKTLILKELLAYVTPKRKKLPDKYQKAIALLVEGMGKAELDLIFTRVAKAKIEEALSEKQKTRIETHEKAVAGSAAPGKEIFDPDKLMGLRDSFLANAQLSGSAKKVCIVILERELQKVYKGDKGESDVQKALKASGKATKVGSVTLGAHSVDNLMHHLRKSAVVADKFATDYERVKDPSGQKPKVPAAKMKESAWKAVDKMVGKRHGWHLFIMSIKHGHHSATLFVEKRPGQEIFLYLADQNWTGLVSHVEKGSMAGFKRYRGESGFDRYLDKATRIFWDDVYAETEKELKKKDPTISKEDIYRKADTRTTLSIWKLARKSSGSPLTLTGLPGTKPAAKSMKIFDYVIRSDDNLTQIAKRYDTTVTDLRTLNGMKPDEALIHPGKKLKVPAPADHHIFNKGESIDKIAAKYGLTKKKLKELNPGVKLSELNHQDPIQIR